jgi:hypothetical protein
MVFILNSARLLSRSSGGAPPATSRERVAIFSTEQTAA